VNRRHFLQLLGTVTIGFGTGIDFESVRPKTHLARIIAPSGHRSALLSSHDEALEWLRRNFRPGDDSIEIHDIARWPFLLDGTQITQKRMTALHYCCGGAGLSRSAFSLASRTAFAIRA
jgi:hypothetical protein